MSKDTLNNIYELVANINKTQNLTGLMPPERNKECSYGIRIESLEEQYPFQKQ